MFCVQMFSYGATIMTLYVHNVPFGGGEGEGGSGKFQGEGAGGGGMREYKCRRAQCCLC